MVFQHAHHGKQSTLWQIIIRMKDKTQMNHFDAYKAMKCQEIKEIKDPLSMIIDPLNEKLVFYFDHYRFYWFLLDVDSTFNHPIMSFITYKEIKKIIFWPSNIP